MTETSDLAMEERLAAMFDAFAGPDEPTPTPDKANPVARAASPWPRTRRGRRG